MGNCKWSLVALILTRIYFLLYYLETLIQTLLVVNVLLRVVGIHGLAEVFSFGDSFAFGERPSQELLLFPLVKLVIVD